MTTNKKVSAYELAKLKILLGYTGKPITHRDYVRKFISTPGRFKTYVQEQGKHANTHFIDFDEVDKWNRQIIASIENKKAVVKELTDKYTP